MAKTTSETVGTKRAAKRGAHAEAHGAPGVRKTTAKVEIDLTAKDAKDRIRALYPAPKTTTMLTATPELERVGLEYIAKRGDESAAGKAKELAGLTLQAAIGHDLGIRGDGWEATYGEPSEGTVDYKAACEANGITGEKLAPFRRPGSRRLTVTETATS